MTSTIQARFSGITATAIIALTAFLPLKAARAADAPATGGPTDRITSAAVSAQGDSSGLMAEIVVTPQRRSEKLQNVPIAMTALTGAQMTALGVTSTTDIIKTVPSVSIYQVGDELVQFNIRGVSQNDFAEHLEGPIAVYYDDAYIGSTAAVGQQIFDMNRVEVLRGPQGTLFGRNATGGLIQYVSKAPTDTFQTGANLTLGDYGLVQSDAYVSGRLADHVLARLAVAQTYSDGYYTNSVGPAPQNQNSYSGRLRLDFDMTDSDTLSLIASTTLNNQRGAAEAGTSAQPNALGLGVALGPDGFGTYANPVTGGTIRSPCAGCDLTGYRGSASPFNLSESNPGRFYRLYDSTELKYVHDFGDELQWTTVVNYQDLNKNYTTDSDNGPADFFDYYVTDKYWQSSFETRFSGQMDKLKWQAGFFYLHMNGDYTEAVKFDLSPYLGLPACSLPSCTTGALVPAHFNAAFSLVVDSYAPFVQTDYNITDDLWITTGIRFTSDTKTYNYHFSDDIGFPAVFYNPSTDSRAHAYFPNYSDKFEINWKPESNVLLYADYSRGTKAGNWAAPSFPPININRLNTDQEVLIDYELGAKTSWFDGRMTLNGAAFYYDYRDYQAFALLGTAQQTLFNVNATIKGAELEMRYNPVSTLQVGMSASYTYGTAYDIPLAHVDISTRMPYTGLTINGLLSYSWPVFDGDLTAQTNIDFVGHHYLTVLNEPINFEPPHTTVDFRLSYAPDDQDWSIAAYVKNIGDVYYRLYGLDVSALSFAESAYAPPRTFGATFGVKF
jgi:iron complex outermembrane receptor protein